MRVFLVLVFVLTTFSSTHLWASAETSGLHAALQAMSTYATESSKFVLFRKKGDLEARLSALDSQDPATRTQIAQQTAKLRCEALVKKVLKHFTAELAFCQTLFQALFAENMDVDAFEGKMPEFSIDWCHRVVKIILDRVGLPFLVYLQDAHPDSFTSG